MKTKSPFFFLLTFVHLLIYPLAAPQPEGSIPFELRGHRIVVQGTAKGSDPLDLMIDTGSTHTLLDRRVARKLGLQPLPEKHFAKDDFGGRRKVTRRVILPQLRFGPVRAHLPCYLADLSWARVDLIVGMDLLGRQDFTIDFTSKQIRFGSSDPLESSASFQMESSSIVVSLSLQGRLARLKLDTGADCLYVFQHRVKSWIKKCPVVGRARITCFGGKVSAPVVSLKRVCMAQSQWRNQDAIVLPRSPNKEADGLLGVVSLGLQRLHFDFQKGLLSWDS